MARKQTAKGGAITLNLGCPNSEPQRRFFESRVKYTCYGGARGGGQSWCTQRKSVGGCLHYAGIKILIVRRRYEDLENSVIEPILNLVDGKTAIYNATQQQRQYERQIRSWKRTARVAEDQGKTIDVNNATARVRVYQKALRELCDRYDLPREYARERV